MVRAAGEIAGDGAGLFVDQFAIARNPAALSSSVPISALARLSGFTQFPRQRLVAEIGLDSSDDGRWRHLLPLLHPGAKAARAPGAGNFCRGHAESAAGLHCDLVGDV